MKKVIIYYSMTGNTLDIANKIKEDTGSDLFAVNEISPDEAIKYDTLILGCPAMGDEELDDTEFLPFYEELKKKLTNQNIFLFGSYGWGDGLWMRKWEEDLKKNNLNLKKEGLIACGGSEALDMNSYNDFINEVRNN